MITDYPLFQARKAKMSEGSHVFFPLTGLFEYDNSLWQSSKKGKCSKDLHHVASMLVDSVSQRVHATGCTLQNRLWE